MATQGTPWICENSTIIAALKKQRGRLTYACKDLGVHYVTLKKRVDEDSELKNLVSDLRNEFENTLLDLAENVVGKAMNDQSRDPTNALKSAFFTLNSKGKTRGWTNTIADLQLAPSLTDLENKNMEIEALKEKLKKYESVDDIQDEPETEPELSRFHT